MTRPLDGLRVLEVGQYIQGPLCASLLGEFGAEVIKIEEPTNGDLLRGLIELGGVPLMLEGGLNVLFEHHNMNKKSIALNLKMEKGKEILYRLIRKTDVFLCTLQQKDVQQLRLDFETLRNCNPQLIYANANAFGAKGPEADQPGYDFTIQAKSGIMSYMGSNSTPMTLGNLAAAHVDVISATVLAFGIVSALVARERFHISQQVSTSLLKGAIHWNRINVFMNNLIGQECRREEREKASNPLYNYYQCADGKWIAIASLQRDEDWRTFCCILELEMLIEDSRFDSAEKRWRNCKVLISILDKTFATKTQQEWLKILRGKGIICAPVNTVRDLTSDAQVLENQCIIDFNHPALGQIKCIGPMVELSETPAGITSAAPKLGQHTDEVLVEVGGYTQDEIAQFRGQGVIR